MKKKKLTMCQIACKAARGETPEGYNVKWMGIPPGTVLEEYIVGEDVELSGDVPHPDRVVLKGSYVVDIGRYAYSDPEDDRKMDFGPVYVFTRFVMNDFKFLYKVERKDEVEKYIMDYMDMIGRVALKKDYVFDVKYKGGVRNGMLMNSQITGMEFPEDDGMIEMNLVCDYVTWFEN